MTIHIRKIILSASLLIVTGIIITSLCLATLTSRDANAIPHSIVPKLNLTQDQTLVFYYFHGHQRCTSCKTIEAYTKQVLKEAFAEELTMGGVQLKIINVDEEVNSHYIDDYQLIFRSVVVSLKQGDREVAWARLDGVWSEIRSWRQYSRYMLSQINKFIRAA